MKFELSEVDNISKICDYKNFQQVERSKLLPAEQPNRTPSDRKSIMVHVFYWLVNIQRLIWFQVCSIFDWFHISLQTWYSFIVSLNLSEIGNFVLYTTKPQYYIQDISEDEAIFIYSSIYFLHGKNRICHRLLCRNSERHHPSTFHRNHLFRSTSQWLQRVCC